jgi:signal transduction histidine kinase
MPCQSGTATAGPVRLAAALKNLSVRLAAPGQAGPAIRAPPTDAMKRSLDTYIFAIFAMTLCAVLAVGGTSLFMVNRMMEKTYAIETESRNVDFINHLHNKTYYLMLAIHRFMTRPDAHHFQIATELSREIDADLLKYQQHEAASAYPESAEEIRLLNQFRAVVGKQHATISAIKALVKPPHEQLEYLGAKLEKNAESIQKLTTDINRLHFEIISRKVAKTRTSMSVVAALYLFFSGIGLAVVYAGYRLHSRHIVEPIKRLARSSGKVADGDLTVRAESDSHTEIGVLYHAFNDMVATLQSHEEKLLEFNRELEQRVRERSLELEAAQSKLVRMEKLAMLGQIATSVNHEIRTPLNALYLNLQLIGKSLEQFAGDANGPRETIGARLAVIDREVARISDILEEFVLFARIAPPRFGDCALNGIVGHVAELLGPRAAQANVRLRLDLAAANPHLMADENKLVQVLVNLGVNAIHAMPEGGTLNIATVDLGASVEITVSDTGVGIPATDLTNIFLPFFSKKATGLGFGLAIAQRIIEDHGGHIVCRSQPGEGAAFVAQLPKSHPVEDGAQHGGITADRR